MKILKIVFISIDVLIVFYFGLLFYFKRFDFLKKECKAKYESSYVIFNNKKIETEINLNVIDYQFNFSNNYNEIKNLVSSINTEYKINIDSENVVMLSVLLNSVKTNYKTDDIVGVFVYEKKHLIFNKGFGYYFKKNKAILYKNSNFITTDLFCRYINQFIEPIETNTKCRLDIFNQRKFTDNDYFVFSNHKGKIVVGM